MRVQGDPRPCSLVGGSTGLPPHGPAVSASPQAFIHTATYTAVPQHSGNNIRHRHSSLSARARVRPRTERAATHRTLLVPVGMETLGMRRFPLETRRASAVMGDKGVDEYSQTTFVEERDRSPSWEAAKGSGSARDAQQQQQRSRLQQSQHQHQRQHQHRHQAQHGQGADTSGEGMAALQRGEEGTDSDPAAVEASASGNPSTSPGWSREGLEGKAEGAEGRGVGDGDGVVVARQKAFVKRIVNLGTRRRAREVLDLMHRVQIEGSLPFNLFMYNACITALARCGRWRQALSVLDGMRQAAAAADAAAAAASTNEMPATGPSRPITDAGPGLGDASANEMPATGQSRPITDGGPGLGKAVVRPDVVSYSAAITACGNAGQRRRALTLLSDMRAEGVFPNVVSYNAAAHACVGDSATGDSAGAEQRDEGCSLVLGLMAEMRADCVSPDVFTFSTAITACGRAGQWKRALSLLEEMEADPDNGQQQQQQHQQTQQQQEWQQQRKQDQNQQRAQSRKRTLTPDVVAINAAISACGRGGQWRRSLDLLDRMTTREGTRIASTATAHPSDQSLPTPNVETPTALASSTAAIPAAASIAAASIAAASNSATPTAVSSNAVSPSTVSPSAVSSSEALTSSPNLTETNGDQGNSRSAEDRNGPDADAAWPQAAWPRADAVSFNSAMEACAKAGQWEEGVALLPRMRQAGVRPDVKSFAASLACLRAGGKWERAVELLEEMEAGKHGLSPDLGCYGAVMTTLGEAGQWERALDLLRLLQRRGAAGAAAWAVEQSSEAGWDAERLAAEATGHAAKTSLSNAGPNLVCYNAAMAACARAGEWAPALDLLKEMEERGIFDTVSFNCAMHACRGQGQWRKATSILGRMVSGDAVRGAGGGTGGGTGQRSLPAPDAYSFTSAITACGAVGQADRAVELLRDMKTAGVAPTVVVFNAVIAAVARSVNRSAVPGRSLDSLGEGEEGLRGGSTGSEFEGGGAQRVATGTVEAAAAAAVAGVGAYAAREDAASEGWASCKRAQELLVEMREAGLVPGLKSYNTVLAVCQRAGEWEGALEVLAEMKRGKTKQRREQSRAGGAAVAASGLEAPVPSPDLISFNTAMGACGRARRWEEALRLLEELRGFGFSPDMVSFNTAAAACARVEKWDLALEVINRGRKAGVLPASVGANGISDDDASLPPQGGEGGGGEWGGVSNGAVEGVGSGGRVKGGGGGRGAVDASGFYFTVEEMVRREERTTWLGGGRSADSGS